MPHSVWARAHLHRTTGGSLLLLAWKSYTHELCLVLCLGLPSIRTSALLVTRNPSPINSWRTHLHIVEKHLLE